MIGYFSSLPPLGLMKPWGDGSRHRHGGPSCSGKMACGPGCKGATRVAHTVGVTQDGTKCSVRLHKRDTVDQYLGADAPKNRVRWTVGFTTTLSTHLSHPTRGLSC